MRFQLKMSVLLFLIMSTCLVLNIHCDKVIMTKNGPVQGITVESEGIFLEAYLGIPFAEPPIGRLRFAKPVPKTPWVGVYDASRLPPTCIQNQTQKLYYLPDVTNMTEDCLYLSIWAPHSTHRDKLKPILFFVHGGAFNVGSSNMKIYDGSNMAARGDVVVVTFNYRVGAMGFFSAFIDDAAGNMGLHDQFLALKWVKDNAASFGGDPDHIVLLGQSAGAMCAAGSILSPIAKHMIKRVILESGAAMLPMILDENARLYKISQSFSKLVGCADKTVTIESNPHIIVNCLKRLPAKELARAEGILMANMPVTFIPRTGDSLLPKTTIELIRNGEFPDMEMLAGVNKDEGTFFLSAAVPQYFGVYGKNAVKSISKRLAFQIIRMFYKILRDPNEAEVAEFYVNNAENGTSDKYIKAISRSIGDYLITCNTIFHSEFHSIKKNPVYFYLFSHRSPSSPSADWIGVTHADEIPFVFGNHLNSENFTEEEDILRQRMMDRWLAFAKTGNPNIENEEHWPLFSYENPEYLEINVKETVHQGPVNNRCDFWRDRFQANIDNRLMQKLLSTATQLSAKCIYMTIALFISVMYIL